MVKLEEVEDEAFNKQPGDEGEWDTDDGNLARSFSIIEDLENPIYSQLQADCVSQIRKHLLSYPQSMMMILL